MAQDDILRWASIIGRHGEVIREAYRSGEVALSDDISKAISDLHSARILAVRDEGRYGLTRLARELLNDSLQARGRFSMGGNVGGEVDRLLMLVTSLEAASGKGIQSDIAEYTEEVRTSLFEISDMISRELSELAQAMEARFADVKTLEEKARHNRHYLDRTKSLQGAVERLNRKNLYDRLENPLIEDVAPTYRRAILRKVPEWTSHLLSSSKVFERFMFTLREVDEKSRRLRAFSKFLSEGGGQQMEAALERAPQSSVMMRVAPQKMSLIPDVSTEASADTLGRIARSIEPITVKKVVERTKGSRRKDIDHSPVEIEIYSEDEAIKSLLDELQAQPGVWISAGDWVTPDGSMTRETFLRSVLTWTETECPAGIKRDIIEDERLAKSANMKIEEIRLCATA